MTDKLWSASRDLPAHQLVRESPIRILFCFLLLFSDIIYIYLKHTFHALCSHYGSLSPTPPRPSSQTNKPEQEETMPQKKHRKRIHPETHTLVHPIRIQNQNHQIDTKDLLWGKESLDKSLGDKNFPKLPLSSFCIASLLLVMVSAHQCSLFTQQLVLYQDSI